MSYNSLKQREPATCWTSSSLTAFSELLLVSKAVWASTRIYPTAQSKRKDGLVKRCLEIQKLYDHTSKHRHINSRQTILKHITNNGPGFCILTENKTGKSIVNTRQLSEVCVCLSCTIMKKRKIAILFPDTAYCGYSCRLSQYAIDTLAEEPEKFCKLM